MTELEDFAELLDVSSIVVEDDASLELDFAELDEDAFELLLDFAELLDSSLELRMMFCNELLELDVAELDEDFAEFDEDEISSTDATTFTLPDTVFVLP